MDWPYFGIFVGILGLFAIAVQKNLSKGFSWLPLVLYMIHQFEEHGIDFLGRPYSFQASICASIGFGHDISSCPATPSFIFAVNVGTVWIAGLLSGIFGKKMPGISCGMIALIFVNALAHILNGLTHGGYNPGLGTSILLFIPFSLWSFHRLLQEKRVTVKTMGLSILVGIAVHIVLMGSLMSHGKGLISGEVLFGIQILNGFIPLVLMNRQT